MNPEDFREVISELFVDTKTYCFGAYPAKHIVERRVLNGCYFNNDEFISLMNALGYKNNKREMFKIRPRKTH